MWQVLLYIQFIYQVSKAVLDRGDKTDRNGENLKVDFLNFDGSMLKTEDEFWKKIRIIILIHDLCEVSTFASCYIYYMGIRIIECVCFYCLIRLVLVFLLRMAV